MTLVGPDYVPRWARFTRRLPICRWWDADSDGQIEPASGEMQYFTNDGNFNTTALIDANSGQVVERYQYDPYGKVTVLNGASGAEKDPSVSEWSHDADNKSDWDNDVLFCGYQYDPVTGLYHVRERYYDPATGTWKTRDRILYPDGMSLYEYVGSSPAKRVDPSGTDSGAFQATPGQPPMGPPIPNDDQIESQTAAYKQEFGRAYEIADKAWDGVEKEDPAVVMRSLDYESPARKLYRAEALRAINAWDKWWAARNDTRHSCGPDVTQNVEYALKDAERQFENLPYIKKCLHCWHALTYEGTKAATGTTWDIDMLHAIGDREDQELKLLREGKNLEWYYFEFGGSAAATGWGKSVSVNGMCYDAGTVNYVLYGMIARLCEKAFPQSSDYTIGSARWNIYKFKLGGYHHLPSTETLAWFDAGAAGWPKGGGQPTSETPYPVRKDSSNYNKYRVTYESPNDAWVNFNAIWYPDINTSKGYPTP